MNHNIPEEPAEKIILPTMEELEEQLEREKSRSRQVKLLRTIILLLVAAVVVVSVIAILLMSVLQIYGDSMTPQLKAGNIVLSKKVKDVENGDIIAFYYEDKVLVKRMIADSGDWIDIDTDGTVYVNGELLEEPYVAEKALGNCNIDLPYQVPENQIFVMGDERSISIDSRYGSVGCVDKDRIIGKLVYRIWPIRDLGPVK